MRVSLSTDSITNTKADLLIVGVRSLRGDRDKTFGAVKKAMGSGFEGVLKAEGFEAKSGQTLKVPGRGRIKADFVLLVGLGSGTPTERAARKLAIRACRAAKRQKSAALVLPESTPEMVRAATDGFVTGVYRYTDYKTGSRRPKGGLKSAALLVDDKKRGDLRDALNAGKIVGESMNLARDLVNGPPNDLNPLTLAETAKAQAKEHGLQCTIWNKAQIKKAGMELFLAVNRGSAIEPRMIHLVHKPRDSKGKVVKADKKVCFVGKGLTFDSGGLCLKPGKSMLDMKCDMAGAAATLGIALAAARLNLPVEVHAVIGSTENMTGAEAYRPGDVFTSLDGKTVEIINTDAEGRLVLADCLAWARELKPDYLIDHATLTGASMVALGPRRASLFCNDDDFAAAYGGAAETADESFWRMPLDEDLRGMLDSHIADLKHTGASWGGSITAALFLREFIGKGTKWCHLDIAGPAFIDRTHGRHPKGGTGFGVATGVSFLEGL